MVQTPRCVLEKRHDHATGPLGSTPQLACEICRGLTEGETLREICKGGDMPAESTVRLWVVDDVGGFAAHYARARLVGYHSMANDLMEIADNPETEAAAVNRDRLKVDTLKWLLNKALPKVYGDKVMAELTGKDGGPIKTEVRSPLELAKPPSSWMRSA